MGPGTLDRPTLARGAERYSERDSEPIRVSLGLQIKLVIRKKTKVAEMASLGSSWPFTQRSARTTLKTRIFDYVSNRGLEFLPPQATQK